MGFFIFSKEVYDLPKLYYIIWSFPNFFSLPSQNFIVYSLPISHSSSPQSLHNTRCFLYFAQRQSSSFTLYCAQTLAKIPTRFVQWYRQYFSLSRSTQHLNTKLPFLTISSLLALTSHRCVLLHYQTLMNL